MLIKNNEKLVFIDDKTKQEYTVIEVDATDLDQLASVDNNHLVISHGKILQSLFKKIEELKTMSDLNEVKQLIVDLSLKVKDLESKLEADAKSVESKLLSVEIKVENAIKKEVVKVETEVISLVMAVKLKISSSISNLKSKIKLLLQKLITKL